MLTDHVRSISYLKTNAAKIIQDMGKGGQPLIITQNGEAQVVVQGIADYEETQETMALLKILALGSRQVEKGRYEPASAVFKKLHKRMEAS
jgi:prevent-host-death family protein